MGELDDSFAQLLGRQPSDAERQQLYRVRDALGLKHNDALWLVLMALQHYQSQYERFPELIANAARQALGEVKTTADAAMRASAESARADLAQGVAEAARQVAHQVAGKQKLQWLAASSAVVCLVLGAVGWFAFSSGQKSGYHGGFGVGYREARDEKAAASWANTPDGKLAYRFAESGELQRLARCQGKGWEIRKSVCLPFSPPNEGTYGWTMP